MTDVEFIEKIVQEVIRRLRAIDSPATVIQDEKSTIETSLSIDDRVVTLASLEGRVAGTSEIVVRSDAVITPSARDELRDRKIKLVRKTK